MGFYSFTCAKTNLPIMASTSWGDEYSGVVILGESGSMVRGIYDGYGNVLTPEGMEVEIDFDSVLSGKLKMVSARFYKGDKYEDLPSSKTDPGQGHFHDEDKVRDWYAKGGFSTWKEYRDTYFEKPPSS